MVRVVYLSKPDKGTYSRPKDFRLISLSSFLLKVLGRLVDRDIRNRSLSVMPLHGANMASKSIETILYQLIYRLDGVLKQKNWQWECL